MTTRFLLPRLSETGVTATLVTWLAVEGSLVQKGQPLLVLESDKAEVEIESPAAGYLRSVMVPAGGSAAAGTLLAVITDTPDEPLEEAATPADPSPAAALPLQKTAPPDASAAQPTGRRIQASPAALQAARQMGIPLTGIVGTGPQGLITRQDVLRAAQGRSEAPSLTAAGTFPLSRLRASVAEKMTRSKQTIPHAYVQSELDADALVEYKQQLAKSADPLVVSYTVLLVKAAALALRRHPCLNAAFQGDRIDVWQEINIGIAVALDDGVIVPVIHQADQLPLGTLASQVDELTSRALNGRLQPDDLAGGTFTLSNLGMYAVDNLIPVILPPQACILGTGRIARKPAVLEDRVVPRWQLSATLSFDHRVLDGVQAARFMTTFQEILKEPSRWMETGE